MALSGSFKAVWLPIANGFASPASVAIATAFSVAELPPIFPMSAPTGQSATTRRSSGNACPGNPSGPQAGNPDIAVHSPLALSFKRVVAAPMTSHATSQGPTTSWSASLKVVIVVHLSSIIPSSSVAGFCQTQLIRRRLILQGFACDVAGPGLWELHQPRASRDGGLACLA